MPDPEPVSLFNPSASAPLLLLCEHASNFIPPQFENLQLSDDALNSHIAFDIGALELAREVGLLLDAPLISTTVSRLVYDCNRPFAAEGAIPEKSEVFQVPGNANLSETEARSRYEKYYLPFESSISERLSLFAETPLLITIHSFTPVYQAVKRTVDIGIISSRDSRLSDQIIHIAPLHTGLSVKANQPYGPEDHVTHTLDLHGNGNTLLNAMIEVKNDLLDSAEASHEIALTLAALISGSAQHFGYQLPPETHSASNH